MKKITTLLAFVILVASAFAQPYERGYERGNDREVVYNDNRYDKRDNRRDDRYSFSKRERDMQIAQINRAYDHRINTVRTKWFTSHGKRQRMIRALEDERRFAIKKVYGKYNHPRNRFDDHDRRREW